MNKQKVDVGDVAIGQVLTPHDMAIYESGKKLLIDSIDAGRDFSKSMITNSTAAIPIYLALIKLVLPDKYRPTAEVGAFLLIPAGGFLLATILFVFSYWPKMKKFSLDRMEKIEEARSSIIGQRRRLAFMALGLFILAVAGGGATAIWALGIQG